VQTWRGPSDVSPVSGVLSCRRIEPSDVIGGFADARPCERFTTTALAADCSEMRDAAIASPEAPELTLPRGHVRWENGGQSRQLLLPGGQFRRSTAREPPQRCCGEKAQLQGTQLTRSAGLGSGWPGYLKRTVWLNAGGAPATCFNVINFQGASVTT
jgi:hypothetical protein